VHFIWLLGAISDSSIYGMHYIMVIGYFSMSQGRLGRVGFVLHALGLKKKSSAPITPIQALPGDSAPLCAINTAATRGGDEVDPRGGWEWYRDYQGLSRNIAYTIGISNDTSPSPLSMST